MQNLHSAFMPQCLQFSLSKLIQLKHSLALVSPMQFMHSLERCKFLLCNSQLRGGGGGEAPSAFCSALAGVAFAGRPRKCAVGGVAHRCLESQVHYVARRFLSNPHTCAVAAADGRREREVASPVA
jgi:hypothetical protein